MYKRQVFGLCLGGGTKRLQRLIKGRQEATAMSRKCTASGDGWTCDKPHFGKGLCSGHYAQRHVRGTPLADLRPMKPKGKRQRHDPNDTFCKVKPGHQGCSRCGKIKPMSQFHRVTSQTDGLSPVCKECCVDMDLEKRHGKGAA